MDGSHHGHDPRDALRIPPQSVPAEQSVLGGLMLAPTSWHNVSDLLTAADFYRRDHQLIWQAIQELAEANKPFDAVTLGEWFEAKGIEEQVSGGAYLIDLASTTPSAANIRAYAQIVADKALLRRLIEAGTVMVNDGFNPDGRDSVEIIGKAQTAIGSLLETQPCELEEMTPVLNRMFENLQRRYAMGGAIDGLSTGLAELDRVLNGLKGGRMYVLAARPGMGKTTLALNVAEHVAVVQGKPVCFFSFEMQQEELSERLTCSLGGIEHQRFRTGQLEDEDWSQVAVAVAKLKKVPLRLSRPSTSRVDSVIAQVRRLHAKKPQALVVVDYLQLMEVAAAENRNAGTSEISRKLKMMTIDLDVPLLVLSQLNRGLESRTNKRPVLSDLRDSGAIEQDADAVIFLYRDEVYHPGSPDTGTTEVIVAKQRNGPTDTVRVATRLNVCRFDDLRDSWAPVPSSNGHRSSATGFRKRRGNDFATAAAGGE